MKNHLLVSLRLTLVLLVITCGIYPMAVWAVGQLAFPAKANGSLIVQDGRVIGSALIGQDFTSERFFHGRPRGVSNLGPTSRALALRLGGRDRSSDAVTTSASGVDPHISPVNAMAQAARVARANGLTIKRVHAMIRARTEGRLFGVYGEPRVNVLLLNLDVMRSRKLPAS